MLLLLVGTLRQKHPVAACRDFSTEAPRGACWVLLFLLLVGILRQKHPGKPAGRFCYCCVLGLFDRSTRGSRLGASVLAACKISSTGPPRGVCWAFLLLLRVGTLRQKHPGRVLGASVVAACRDSSTEAPREARWALLLLLREGFFDGSTQGRLLGASVVAACRVSSTEAPREAC